MGGKGLERYADDLGRLFLVILTAQEQPDHMAALIELLLVGHPHRFLEFIELFLPFQPRCSISSRCFTE